MAKVKKAEKIKLLDQISKYLETATQQAHSAARSASNNIKAGRMEDCIQAMLEIEPKLHDARKLFVMATYVNDLGRYGKK